MITTKKHRGPDFETTYTIENLPTGWKLLKAETVFQDGSSPLSPEDDDELKSWWETDGMSN